MRLSFNCRFSTRTGAFITEFLGCRFYCIGGGAVDAAVVTAVSEVDHQADREPDEEPDPRDPWQPRHQEQTKSDPGDGHRRHPWGPKRPMLLGIDVAQNPYTQAYEDKREQRADIGELRDFLD